jgi:L-gulonolactone oxidase
MQDFAFSYTNWANTFYSSSSRYYEPDNVNDVCYALEKERNLVSKRGCSSSNEAIRVIGGLHSPNDCAMTKGAVINLRKMCRVLQVNKASRLVKVEAGILLRDLNSALDAVGLALPNQSSISDQSLAGCIATGTHGTGFNFQMLASAIVEIQIVLADGSVHVCSRERDDPQIPFLATLCHLGCLGIITGAVIECSKAFDVHVIETPTNLDAILDNSLETRIKSCSHYRFWWFPHTNSDLVSEWRGERVTPHLRTKSSVTDDSFLYSMEKTCKWLFERGFGYYAFEFALFCSLPFPYLVPWISQIWSNALFGTRKESINRSDLQFNIDCLFKQHVDEWSLPLSSLRSALTELRALVSSKHRVHFPVEVRFVACDDSWLSPSTGQKGDVRVYVGIIAYRPYGLDSPYKKYFADYEEIMARHNGRPHWAKVFGLQRDEFESLYTKWDDFIKLRRRIDPLNLFVNNYLERILTI